MYRKTTLVLIALFSSIIAAIAQVDNSSVGNAADSLSVGEEHLPWDVRVKTELYKLAIEAEDAYYNTGICVWDLTADSLLFGYNNQKVMRPASTQKVFTAISALSILGAKHEFRTRAYYTGSITPDSVLMGDIYVVGDYDPMYSYDDLKMLAKRIKDLGVKRINGRLYGDSSMKSKELYGNGWCWDDVPSSGQPYHCALMLERGTIAPNFNKYSEDRYFNPAQYFVSLLSNELYNSNVLPYDTVFKTILCETKEMTVPGNCFYTKPCTIETVLQRMMKNSDNHHAEAVFYQIANLNANKYCTWKDGARQVENVMRKAGINTAYCEVADGSGVSLYNYTTPSAEVAMLRYAYQNEDIYKYLLPSLPIAGVDGTLSSRMTEGSAYGNVQAKTGTVEGCSCICGYVTASNGHKLAFSIMNNGVLKSKTGRDYQDRICQELAR